MTHDQQVENVGAYALGALPELEARVFERHLMGCEACQRELLRAQQAVDALARSVTAYDPPPSLKHSLMATVSAEASSARALRRASWMPRLRPAIGFAALAVAVAVAFVAGGLFDADDATRTIAAEVDQSRLPGGSASLVIPDDEGSGAVLRVTDLPTPGRQRVYQVWIERRGEAVPVSIFDVDSDGSGAAAIPGSLEDVTAVMVTRERRGGAPAPTEPPSITADV